jgi:hypothetical protein
MSQVVALIYHVGTEHKVRFVENLEFHGNPLLHFHHYHEELNWEVHHCGKPHRGLDYTVEHCIHGLHSIDQKNAKGHDENMNEVWFRFLGECETGKWHVESGIAWSFNYDPALTRLKNQLNIQQILVTNEGFSGFDADSGTLILREYGEDDRIIFYLFIHECMHIWLERGWPLNEIARLVLQHFDLRHLQKEFEPFEKLNAPAADVNLSVHIVVIWNSMEIMKRIFRSDDLKNFYGIDGPYPQTELWIFNNRDIVESFLEKHHMIFPQFRYGSWEAMKRQLGHAQSRLSSTTHEMLIF